MTRISPNPKLYWCSTPDQADDWFVVARGAREARRFFCIEEGYGPDDVESKLVAVLPSALADVPTGWADDEVIRRSGGNFLRVQAPRCVAFDTDTFIEGAFDFERATIMDDQFEAAGEGRPNGTRRSEVA